MMERRDKACATRSVNYRSLRNRARCLIRRDQLQSTISTINKSGNDPAKIWKLANEALGATSRSLPHTLGKGPDAVTAPLEKATTLNRFYISKIDRLRQGIESTHGIPARDWEDRTDVGTSSASPSFSFNLPSSIKVLHIILGLKDTGATGHDGIPVAALKLAAVAIAPAVAHLIRRSFLSAVVPTAFKLATVSPIYKGKKKDPNDPGSYRPVSILTALSKVMEKAAHACLAPYLGNLLPGSQFGFRAKRSTSTAIATAHGHWTAARAAGKVVGVAAYDLSSAFDTLDVLD